MPKNDDDVYVYVCVLVYAGVLELLIGRSSLRN